MSGAGIVTAATLLGVGLAWGPWESVVLDPFAMARRRAGPVVGAWLSRGLVDGGPQNVGRLLVRAALGGVTRASVTMPHSPPEVWGGPLRLGWAAIAWLAACVFSVS